MNHFNFNNQYDKLKKIFVVEKTEKSSKIAK